MMHVLYLLCVCVCALVCAPCYICLIRCYLLAREGEGAADRPVTGIPLAPPRLPRQCTVQPPSKDGDIFVPIHLSPPAALVVDSHVAGSMQRPPPSLTPGGIESTALNSVRHFLAFMHVSCRAGKSQNVPGRRADGATGTIFDVGRTVRLAPSFRLPVRTHKSKQSIG